MKHYLTIGFLGNITVFMAVMLFSCSNPDAVIREMASTDTLSGIVADSVVFFRSDSGVVTMELHTPRLVRIEEENPVMEFPLGFVAYMYDKQRHLTTEFSADYGKNHNSGKLIEAIGNVKVQNFDLGQTMFSDKLYWYQEEKVIHTRSFVRIVTPDKEIEADSLVALEDFSEYTLFSGRAVLDVEEEEQEEQEQ